VLASVELWDDSTVLHFARERQPAPGLKQRAVEWRLTDNLGTPYTYVGGGLGGADRMYGHAVFKPAVPSEATHLHVVPSLLRLSEPIDVDLST
jgi:hypothetical protein